MYHTKKGLARVIFYMKFSLPLLTNLARLPAMTAIKSPPKIRKMKSCNQCEHVWFSSLGDRPSQCPKCKSTKWDQAKKEKKEEVEVEQL